MKNRKPNSEKFPKGIKNESQGASAQTVISGKNAVIQRLEQGESLNRNWLADNLRKDERVRHLMELASMRKVKYQFVERRRLDQICGGEMHQGVAGEVPPFNYSEWENVREKFADDTAKKFVILLDGIEDPHNLGAILRTAAAVSADLVVLPKHRSAQITDAVVRASAGNAGKVPVARVTNPSNFLSEIKELGFWVYGLAGEAKEDYSRIDYANKTVIVVGNEGKGISPLTAKRCDELVRIPMNPTVESLNASVSAALLMYKIFENSQK